MANAMTKPRKPKWKQKACGCVKAELSIGRVLIRCTRHRDKLYSGDRVLCYFGEDGIVHQKGHTPSPSTKPEPPREEFVYFLRVGKRIKIGYSNDPERRARDLQAELIGFAPGGRKLEAALHYELREYRDRKEWYRDKPAVQIAMNKVLARR